MVEENIDEGLGDSINMFLNEDPTQQMDEVMEKISQILR
jgi:hypothetical protein